MAQKDEITLITKPIFQAIGLRWEGTFAEANAGGIREVHRALQKRLPEIQQPVDQQHFYGLSYHAYPEGTGFTHYAVVEMDNSAPTPPGMLRIHVPALTYAKLEHRKGQSIQQSYTYAYAWMKEEHLAPDPGELTHFEVYPMQQNPFEQDPVFTILIPVIQVTSP
ncbi:GyrI-like domain-containing protein [Paenibacillus aestuarii]|uniref:GyrI-like domain-containing protein n=1 Tax=Paenibacillus aestuarii TaxID=516965 RepID=A0ABW0KCN2_9BACL|nr:effector binding domain-containing protein [Paenibacillus aestuarii]